MRWLAKALIQKSLGSLPFGENVNYLLQRYVTGGHPISDEVLVYKIEQAKNHFMNFQNFCTTIRPEDATFYEFGAGYNLALPLTFSRMGVRTQTVIDMIPHARFSLINDLIQRMAHLGVIVDDASREPEGNDTPAIRNLDDLLRIWGIDYKAPADARSTEIPGKSIDFISNSDTLEHISTDDLKSILAECRRVLKPGGIMSCDIDLKDHFSYFDRKISHYNFLRFRTLTWNVINSTLNYQNRLRYPDYLRIIQSAGFRIIKETTIEPSPQDLDLLAGMKLSGDDHKGYTPRELGIKGLLIVAQRA